MKNKFVLTTLILLFSVTVYSQSVTSLENRYGNLSRLKAKETTSLDSLQNVFDTKTKEIDEKKKAIQYDQEAVKKLMASSVSLSNQIEEKQKSISRLSAEINKVSTDLDKTYTQLIDSLETVEKSSSSNSREAVRAQILDLTERKLLITPIAVSLSFSPEKILALNPANAKNEIERKMFSEYLNEAINEIENKLEQVNENRKEVKQIISLQKKSRKFLEEVGFNSEVNRTPLKYSGSQLETATTNDKSFGAALSYSPQFQSYVFILKQLETDPLSDSNIQNYSTILKKEKKIGIKEYSSILSDVEDRLNEYKTVLMNKLKSSK